jgi:hypothetical protein
MKPKPRIAVYFSDTNKPLAIVHATIGAFAVHLLLNASGKPMARHWSVTHIPTGLRATFRKDYTFASRAEAIDFARMLSAFGDWHTTDVADLSASVRAYRAVCHRLDCAF